MTPRRTKKQTRGSAPESEPSYTGAANRGLALWLITVRSCWLAATPLWHPASRGFVPLLIAPFHPIAMTATAIDARQLNPQ